MNSPSSSSSVLIAEPHGEVVHLILNRPEKRNALSLELLRELDTALARIAEDKAARVVVIVSLRDAIGRNPARC